MSTTFPILGGLITNTEPARLPGPEDLVGKHVTLTRLTEEHFSSLYDNIGVHADLWIYWPDGPFDTPSAFNDNLIHFLDLSPDLATYAVLLPSGPLANKAVGLAFAQSTDRLTNRIGEIGLFYGPSLQRTIAATEVVYLLAVMMFELNHRRLQWKTDSLNLQSRKAAERYGFVFEGTSRQSMVCKGRNRDTAWYSVLDGEWELQTRVFETWLAEDNFDRERRQRTRIEDVRASSKKQEEQEK